MTNWAERIPAAIARADKILDETCTCARSECRIDRGSLTRIEIALAKALWEAEVRIEKEWRLWGPWDDWIPSVALCAFVAKVEPLDT